MTEQHLKDLVEHQRKQIELLKRDLTNLHELHNGKIILAEWRKRRVEDFLGNIAYVWDTLYLKEKERKKLAKLRAWRELRAKIERIGPSRGIGDLE